MAASSPFTSITPLALQDLLLSSEELALLDVREARAYVGGHLTLARLAPLSTLEMEIAALVPRSGTHTVLVDGGDSGGPAARAARLLARLGYTNVEVLAGGTSAWLASGLPLLDGYGTLVKAFGDRVRKHHATPAMRGDALRALPPSAPRVLSIDARPSDEYAFLSLPDSANYPGTELALRQWSPDSVARPWIINCFSRTRGIIGTTTLRLLGHPDARFLEDGVMQWALDGAEVVHQAEPRLPLPQAPEAELRSRARRLIDAYGVGRLAPAELMRLRAEVERTLFVFDLRPNLDAKGMPPGVRAVAGGQLLMHFENLVGTRNARIVLLDDPHGLRAAVTAFWLMQLNQAQVFVLDGGLPAAWLTASMPADALAMADDALPAQDLHDSLKSGSKLTHIVDVGPSSEFERRHLPGSYFLLPYTMEPLQPIARAGHRIVFTSPDGRAARLATRHAAERWPAGDMRWLAGGTSDWHARGLPTEQAWQPWQLLTPFDDDWGSVMRVEASRRNRAWIDYLAWERDLDARVATDPTVRFRLL